MPWLGPAVKPGGAGPPEAVAAGDVAPGGASSQHPEDAIDDGAVVFEGGALFLRLLGWQQGFKLLPLVVS